MERNKWFNQSDREAAISRIQIEESPDLPDDPKERRAAIRKRIFTEPARNLNFVLHAAR